MTDLERIARRLDSHRRYNRSVKGIARNQRYESKHPERKQSWAPIMLAKARDKR